MNDGARRSCRRAIGGEPELKGWPEGPPGGLAFVARGRPGTWTSSGRTALWVLLESVKRQGARRVLLPSFICDSVTLAAHAAGLPVSYFPVRRDLRADPDPRSGDAVVLVDYFGWPSQDQFSRTMKGENFWLLRDVSHSLLSPWAHGEDGSANVFGSVRKLGNAVLGGWTSAEGGELNPLPQAAEKAAWRALAGRLVKAAYLSSETAAVNDDTEAMYLSAFAGLEEELDRWTGASPPPGFALDLIDRMDWLSIVEKRRKNWTALWEKLEGGVDSSMRELPDGVTPLGFHFVHPNRDELRRSLAQRGIFCPIHWPIPRDVNDRVFLDSALLAKTGLTLPVDQRYGTSDMERMAEALREVL